MALKNLQITADEIKPVESKTQAALFATDLLPVVCMPEYHASDILQFAVEKHYASNSRLQRMYRS